MTENNPSGNLQQGSHFRPVRLRTSDLSRGQVPLIPDTPREERPLGLLSVVEQETLAPRQTSQNSDTAMQDTGPQPVPQKSDISTLNTSKYPVTPMPSIQAPITSPTPVPQSDLEHDARIYSDSAKLYAFVTQHNPSNRNGYAAPQQQISQHGVTHQQFDTSRQTDNSPLQQQTKQVTPQQKETTFAPVKQQVKQAIPQPATRNPGPPYMLAVFVGLTALPVPYIAHLLIDQALSTKDGILIFWLFALVLGLLLLQTVLHFITSAVTSSLQRARINRANATLYERVLHSPRIVQANTQYILNHLNALTAAQESVIQIGSSFATACIMALFFISALFLVDWRLAGATILVALLYLGVGSIASRRYRRASQQAMESYDNVNDTLAQGIASLQARNTIPFLEHTVQTTLNEAAQHSYQRAFVGSSIRLTVGVMQSVGSIVLTGLGIYLLLTHVITSGQCAAFVLLLLLLSVPLTAFTTLMQQQQAVSVAEQRVKEIL